MLVHAARDGVRRPGRLAGFDERLLTPILVIGYAIVVALGAIWTVSLISEVSGPITAAGHHDFFAFYAAGTLVRGHQADLLYSAPALTAIERRIWAQPTGYAGYMPFLNPPAAAVILAPLSALPEAVARIVWLGISLALAVVSALVLTTGRDRRVRILAVVAVLASFPAYQTFTEGQWSFVMLLGVLATLIAARLGHPWLAGFALVALWLKPPLLALVLVWLVLTRTWRVAMGALVAVVGVTVLTLPWAGVGPDVAYIRYLGEVTLAHASGAGAVGQTTWEGALPNMEGLIGFAAAIIGQQHPLGVDLLTVALAVTLLGYLVWALRGRGSQLRTTRIAMAAACMGFLLDPHLYAQDCVLLLVLAALALRETPGARTPNGLVAASVPRWRIDAAVVLAAIVLLDLSAIDTLWVQGVFFKPLHLLTISLIAGVVLLAWPRKRQPAAPDQAG